VLRGVTGEGRRPLRAGYAALVDGVIAGELTSGNFSPVLGCGIGMGFLQLGLPDGAELEVDARGRALTCHIARLPFVKKSGTTN
jgi:aminomethyltransferase